MGDISKPETSPAPAFRVSVQPMQASNGLTYVVCLDRGDRPRDAKPWDDGRITPVNRNSVEEANAAAQEWADFLGVPYTPCEPVPDTRASDENSVPEYGQFPVRERRRGPVKIALHDIMGFNLYTNWSQAGCGFGQLSLNVQLVRDDAGARMRVSGDTETMGPKWTRQALYAVADTIANSLPPEGLSGDIDVAIPAEVLAYWEEERRLLEGDDNPT